MEKSESKKNMEKAVLEAVYWMGVESLEPSTFEALCSIIDDLHETRNLGTSFCSEVERLKCAHSDMAEMYRLAQVEIKELKLLYVPKKGGE